MATSLRLVLFVALLVAGAWLVPGAGAQTTDTADPGTTPTAEADDAGQVTSQEQEDDLPATGTPVWLYAVAGAGVLHVGASMLVAEQRLRRPDGYWEHHGG